MRLRTLVVVLVLVASGVHATPGLARPLRVVTSVTDLAALVRIVGGSEVEAFSLVKGPQDPHAIEPRPSFIQRLHRADLLVVVGMDLELGWLPPLLNAARNPGVAPGRAGHLDASTAIRALGVPGAGADRSLGDVHLLGNPHYLTDPVNGWRVARLIVARLGELRPESLPEFEKRLQAFERTLAERLAGEAAVAEHGSRAILAATDGGRLARLLGGAAPAGWLAVAPEPRALAVEDHDYWVYFAARFGLDLVGTLEPGPGIAPTTRHLARMVELVKARSVPVILASPYFDPRHARWVAERTGARVISLAHQVGSLEGVDDYLAAIEHNVRALREALEPDG